METLVRILHEKGCSLVVRKNGEIRTYTDRGVLPLLDLLLNDGNFLKGSEVADKVVGKAAAALMAVGRVKAVHSDVISDMASDLLKNEKIEYSYSSEVERILSRDKQDFCPMEMLTETAQTPQEAVQRLIEELK